MGGGSQNLTLTAIKLSDVIELDHVPILDDVIENRAVWDCYGRLGQHLPVALVQHPGFDSFRDF
jgi:hypothetical protein